MFEPEELLDAIYDLEEGEPRIKALASAIEEADKNGDNYWRLYFRHDYIHESIFHGDNFKAIIQFPEYLKLFDEHPEFEEDMSHDMMWTFKNVLENMHEYYQISRAEIEKYFEEFKKRSEKYGESLRTYYMKKCRFYLYIDKNLAKEAYKKFHKFPRTANSDCLACEMNFDMDCALELDDEEKALKIAKPILDGKRTCAEIPHCTYAELAKYYIYHDNLDEALYYATLCERLVLDEPETFLEKIGFLLEVYSIVKLQHGWNIFKHMIPEFVNCKNPAMKLAFARGAYRVLKALAEQTEFLLNSNLKALPVPKSEDGWETKAICDYFYQIAKDMSEKLDTRNGSRYYQELLETEFVKQDNKSDDKNISEKLLHGIVKKENTVLITALPEMPENDNIIIERMKKAEKDIEILNCDADEKEIYISAKYKDKIHEMHLFPMTDEFDVSYMHPVYHMSDETFEAIIHSGNRYVLVMELNGQAQDAYHVYMQVLSIAFPDMLGVINLLARKIYPANWVKYAGMFANAVSPADVYGFDIPGTEDGSNISIITIGLCALGMREIEIIGANKDNFHYFLDMVSYTAYQCVANDMLPDENQVITSFYENDKEYEITWNAPEKVLSKLPEDYLAVRNIETPSGDLIPAMLILKETDNSPAINPVFENLDNLYYPNLRSDFYRNIRLAKESFAIFKNALSRKFERGAVRLEIELDEEQQEEFDYGIELVWADLKQVDDSGNSYVACLAEEFEALPNYHIGDEIVITQENIASWVILFDENEEPVTQEEAYLLL